MQNGSVINGSIHYPKGFGMIFIKNDEEKIVLTAEKVRLFRYYDSISNINRKFVSIKKNDHTTQFYEVVINGEVSVVREMKKYADRSHPDEIDSYRYFAHYKNLMIPLTHFRNKVYPKLVEEQPIDIRTYVRGERLDPNEMQSALLIIKEFNRVKQGNLQARAN